MRQDIVIKPKKKTKIRGKTHIFQEDIFCTTMDQFQCFECGMVTRDQDKVNKHMLASHGIKVETEMLNRKFSCTLCNFSSRDMEEF